MLSDPSMDEETPRANSATSAAQQPITLHVQRLNEERLTIEIGQTVPSGPRAWF